MAVSVPDYQQQVQPVTPEVQKASFAQPIPEAFGGDVGAAISKMGGTIQASAEQIQTHLIQRQQQQQEMDVYNKLTDFRNQQNIRMNGDPNDPNAMVTRNINGKNVSVPAGIMNRLGSSSQGAYQELSDGFKTDAKETLDSFNTPQQKMLASKLMNWDSRYYLDTASAHEAKQMNIAFENNNLTSQQSNIDLASKTGDPSLVAQYANNNKNLQILLSEHKGINPLLEGKNSIDSSVTAVIKSAIAGQINGGNFQ